jgi:molecular chaperone DnaK
LAKLRNDAISFSQTGISQAVLSVPTQFHHLQRTALREAASWIQLPVRELVDEPIAAARYLTDGTPSDKRVLIYSLGSESFEASLVHCAHGQQTLLSTNGCANLGGRSIDTLIAREMQVEYQRLFGEGEYSQACELQLLRLAEQAKIAMSEPGLHPISVQGLVGRKPFEFLLTRRHFERFVEPKIASSLSLCDQTLSEAKMEWADVDAVYLIGGSASLAQLRSKLMKHSGLAAETISSRQSLHAAAFGAALLAADRQESVQNDVRQSSYVSAYDLGIRIRGSDHTKAVVYRMIKRNGHGKSSACKQFKTSRDNQQRLVLEVVQSRRGESKSIGLGYFVFGPFDGKPAGHPVDVSMSYDASGCVSVVATDPVSGKKVRHTVTAHPSSSSEPLDERERLQVNEYADWVS